jgi:hypothetical protein
LANRIMYVWLDVHKERIVVAVAEGGLRGEVREYGRIANTTGALDRMLRKLGPDGVKLRFCYEAGPCGYGIQRRLSARGQNSERAPEPAMRHHVAVTQSEERHTAHIHLITKLQPRRNPGSALCGPQQKAETQRQTGHPDTKKQRHGQWTEDAEKVFSPTVARQVHR